VKATANGGGLARSSASLLQTCHSLSFLRALRASVLKQSFQGKKT
jgi:hypothetical protein